MRSLEWVLVASLAGVIAGCAATPAKPDAAAPGASGYGRPVSESELARWDIDVRTKDGVGLPAGSGTVEAGKALFAAKCAACHGDAAAGGPVYGTMVGGIGSFTTERRVLTPGSMYPYAPVLFDYVRRAMPMNAPQSLDDNEVYAISAYMLHLNGLVPADAVMNASTLAAVRMPNRDGFIVDDRPDTQAKRCMSGCPPISGRP